MSITLFLGTTVHPSMKQLFLVISVNVTVLLRFLLCSSVDDANMERLGTYLILTRLSLSKVRVPAGDYLSPHLGMALLVTQEPGNALLRCLKELVINHLY